MAEEFPTRLRVLKSLTALLETITVANGYKNDLAGKVFRGRTLFGDDDPIPMVSILEVPIAPDTFFVQVDSGVNYGSWDLVIQGWAKDDKVNPTDPAQILQADVTSCLAKHKEQFGTDRRGDCKLLGMGDIVTDMRIGIGVVRPPDEHVSAYAYFWLPLRLTVAEDMDMPYGE